MRTIFVNDTVAVTRLKDGVIIEDRAQEVEIDINSNEALKMALILKEIAHQIIGDEERWVNVKEQD